MATILGRSLVYVGVVVILLLGLATPANSLFLNSSNPLFCLEPSGLHPVNGACSSTCESKNCLNPATLRYGKYCGIGYTGCSGQQPCDGLDSCCETHDACIGSHLANYANRTCNDNLKTCINTFQSSNQTQFAGNNCSKTEVGDVIKGVIDVITVGGYGNPSSPMNLHWVIILVFVLPIFLFHS